MTGYTYCDIKKEQSNLKNLQEKSAQFIFATKNVCTYISKQKPSEA